MPDTNRIVINTGPLLALIAAFDDLAVLKVLYQEILIPFEVSEEILAPGPDGFGVQQFRAATWLSKHTEPIDVAPMLFNSLDRGEAAVIQLALNENIQTVCIDEAVGRRMARLNDLVVTGSVGILLRAHREQYPFSMRTALQKMTQKGIWLSNQVIDFALQESGEGESTDQ